jgi:hypothetical protein
MIVDDVPRIEESNWSDQTGHHHSYMSQSLIELLMDTCPLLALERSRNAVETWRNHMWRNMVQVITSHCRNNVIGVANEQGVWEWSTIICFSIYLQAVSGTGTTVCCFLFFRALWRGWLRTFFVDYDICLKSEVIRLNCFQLYAPWLVYRNTGKQKVAISQVLARTQNGWWSLCKSSWTNSRFNWNISRNFFG